MGRVRRQTGWIFATIPYYRKWVGCRTAGCGIAPAAHQLVADTNLIPLRDYSQPAAVSISASLVGLHQFLPAFAVVSVPFIERLL